MISKALLFLGVVVLGWAFVSYTPSKVSSEPCSTKNASFSHGERLVYKLYYNWGVLWIPAGEVNFDVKETTRHYDITITGKTYSSYDPFFRVRDYYFSRVDKQTLLPSLFLRKVEEGDYRKYDSVRFDQKSLKAWSLTGKSRQSASLLAQDLPTCMHDLISIFYYLRNSEVERYQPGDYIDTQMFFDREVFPIKVYYSGKEQKEVKNLAKLNTIVVSPKLIVGNVFKEGDEMKIWVTDDKNKIPVLIESPIAVGSVKAVLKSWSGLRHPHQLPKK